ncbi:MAG: acetate--CoA ligase family protein, partial [Halodesulfurarchaeum sp.]
TPVAVSAGVPDSTTGQVPEGTHLSLSGGRLRNSLIRQAGAVPTTSIETMVDAAPALGGQPLPDTDGVAVVSNAGGPGVMAIDAVARSALTPVTLADSTVERLDAALPEHARSQNPLDLLADSDIEVFETAMDAVLTDDAVGAALVISAPSALFTFEELAAILADARRRHEAPVVTALMGGTRTHDAEAVLREAGIPNYFDPFRAVDALETLWIHSESRPRRQREPSLSDGVNPDFLRNVLEDAPDQSIQIEGEDIGSVLSALGVDEGVMSPPPGGDAATGAVEVDLLGVRHPGVGPIVGVGVSTFVRAVGDWAARGVPLSRNDAEEMVQELRAWPILRGTRGQEPVDIDGLVDVIVGVSWLLDTIPSVTALSLDPLLVGESGVGASSIRVRRGRE